MPSLLATAISVVALVSTTSAVCNDGELAIGYVQLCSINGGMRSGCGPLTGAIWASNCDDIDSTSNNGYCNGGWEQGTTVTCDSNGYTPDYIGYNGGAYGYCYEPNNGGEACDAGFESYTSVAYCCPPE